MVKLEITIKEKRKIETESLVSTGLDLEIKEIGINSTIAEKEGSNYLKEKLEVENKLQFINKSRNKEIEEIIKKLI